MKVKIFQIPKPGIGFSEIQDRFSYTQDNKIFVVADGATGTLFSDQWAKHLTTEFCNKQPDFTRAEFEKFVSHCMETFNKSKIDSNQSPAMQALLKQKMSLGSSAAFLAVRLDEARKKIDILQYGDCRFNIVRNGKFLKVYSEKDDYLNKFINTHKKISKDKIFKKSLPLKEGDNILLSSDSIADYINPIKLKSEENKKDYKISRYEKLKSFKTFDKFKDFIHSKWESSEIETDDITFINICIDKDRNDISENLPGNSYEPPALKERKIIVNTKDEEDGKVNIKNVVRENKYYLMLNNKEVGEVSNDEKTHSAIDQLNKRLDDIKQDYTKFSGFQKYTPYIIIAQFAMVILIAVLYYFGEQGFVRDVKDTKTSFDELKTSFEELSSDIRKSADAQNNKVSDFGMNIDGILEDIDKINKEVAQNRKERMAKDSEFSKKLSSIEVERKKTTLPLDDSIEKGLDKIEDLEAQLLSCEFVELILRGENNPSRGVQNYYQKDRVGRIQLIIGLSDKEADGVWGDGSRLAWEEWKCNKISGTWRDEDQIVGLSKEGHESKMLESWIPTGDAKRDSVACESADPIKGKYHYKYSPPKSGDGDAVASQGSCATLSVERVSPETLKRGCDFSLYLDCNYSD